jgi:hypothetical protein
MVADTGNDGVCTNGCDAWTEIFISMNAVEDVLVNYLTRCEYCKHALRTI